MFNKNNYFTNSRGNFNQVHPKMVEKILGEVRSYVEMNFSPEEGGWGYRFTDLPRSIKLGNRIWNYNFMSYSQRWGSTSIYYVSEDETHLMRISDHWSESSVDTNNCGNIRFCYWCLKGNPYRGVKIKYHDKKFFGGIIPFKELY